MLIHDYYKEYHPDKGRSIMAIYYDAFVSLFVFLIQSSIPKYPHLITLAECSI